MQKGNTKLFKDKQRLYRAIELYRDGWTISFVSSLNHCDRSSLRGQYEKYGIVPLYSPLPIVYISNKIIKVIFPEQIRRYLVLDDGEKINLGKRTYKDYLMEYKNKHIPIHI
jgi:hypothetical protein